VVIGSKIQTGLPQVPSGVPEPLFNQFFIIYQAIQNLARQFSEFAGVDEWDSTIWSQLSIDDTIWKINPARLYVPQNEALVYGECASLILDAGILKVRKADATNNTRPAVGFVSSQDHVSAVDQFCETTIGVGLITGVSGMITAARYFTHTTPGVITNVAPVAAGNIEQVVGVALSGNRLLMNIDQAWIQH